VKLGYERPELVVATRFQLVRRPPPSEARLELLQELGEMRIGIGAADDPEDLSARLTQSWKGLSPYTFTRGISDKRLQPRQPVKSLLDEPGVKEVLGRRAQFARRLPQDFPLTAAERRDATRRLGTSGRLRDDRTRDALVKGHAIPSRIVSRGPGAESTASARARVEL
jgi:hypothetical protein